MGQFISVEVEAETILDAMADDGNFAGEVWSEIEDRLNQGALLDDCIDIVQTWPTTKKLMFVDSLKLMVNSIEGQIENEGS